MTVVSATDSTVVARLSESMADGTYLLTVFRGYLSTEWSTFHMAVQTPRRRPQGPRWARGPGRHRRGRFQGDTGAAGPKGDTGAVGRGRPGWTTG